MSGGDADARPALMRSMAVRSAVSVTATVVSMSTSRFEVMTSRSVTPVVPTVRVWVDRTRGSGCSSSRWRWSATKVAVEAPAGAIESGSPGRSPTSTRQPETRRVSEK
jgi:hypothetical protein